MDQEQTIRTLCFPGAVKNKGGAKSSSVRKQIRTVHPIDQRLAGMGKSRSWLARKIGRSEQSISLYCNRKQVLWPNSIVTKHICEALGVNIDFLMLGLQGPEQEKASQIKGKSQQAGCLSLSEL